MATPTIREEKDDDDTTRYMDRAVIEDNERFLAEMNATLVDPTEPEFTYDEVYRCHLQVVGPTNLEGADEHAWIEYCRKHMNKERDDLCFYK